MLSMALLPDSLGKEDLPLCGSHGFVDGSVTTLPSRPFLPAAQNCPKAVLITLFPAQLLLNVDGPFEHSLAHLFD